MSAVGQASSMTTYLGEIGRIAILSRDQQLLHSKRIRRWIDWPGGRDQAPAGVQRAGKRSTNRMVESNLRMVVAVAKKYNGQGVPIEDLIQEGSIGLLTACEKFDPERGYCFSTFSYWWIRQGMTRCLANSSRLIRIPCNTSELARKLRRLQCQWLGSHGRHPSLEELAEATAQPISRIKMALQATAMQPLSLDQLVTGDGCPLMDLVAAEAGESGDQQLERQLQADRLRAALWQLPDLERLTLEGLVFQWLTHREVAEQLKLSATRVGQLQRLAVSRLQQLLAPESVTGLSKKQKPVTTMASAVSASAASTASYENIVLPV